jgi:hypothetical protein
MEAAEVALRALFRYLRKNVRGIFGTCSDGEE